MLINNLLLRNTNIKNPQIMYSYSEDKEFPKILKKIFGHSNVCVIEESIFSHMKFDLVICNNKLDVLERCLSLCYYFHCPLLIVDHKPKPEHLHINKVPVPEILYYQIATNQHIANSWGADMYHNIIGVDISNQQCLEAWEQSIRQISKQPFKRINKQKVEQYE